MAPESVPFLLTAVFVFVAAIAAGGWAMLRLARLAGARGVGPSGEGFVIMLVTLLGYELLPWRMAGSSPPVLVGVVVLAAAVPAAAFSCRRRVGMFALAVGASLLSGLWAVGASLTALGNPTAHALREGRAICLPTPAAAHVAIASGVSQRVTSPRRTRARSYSAQFPTRYVVLYFGCTLDFTSRS